MATTGLPWLSGSFPTNKSAIVGVDLGTAYSGISFMLRSDPSVVQASSPRAQPNQHKEPTVMLRTQSGEWLFGMEALEHFRRCVNEDDEDGGIAGCTRVSSIRLFKTFKLNLLRCDGADEFHEVVVSAKNTAAQGVLLDIYTHCLTKLKDHAFSCLTRELGRTPLATEVLWVLTVPAKTSDWALQFMREVAVRAGELNPSRCCACYLLP